MRRFLCIPLVSLCVLLSGCSEKETQYNTQQVLDLYTQMTGATMEAEVVCQGDSLVSNFTLRCDYQAQGETMVEVLSPDTMAGVRGVLTGGEWVLEYEDKVFNVGALSSQAVSPLACIPLLMEGMRQGWVLEQSQETYQNTGCVRLSMDYDDQNFDDITVTVWLSMETGAPVGGEVLVEGQQILQVAFTFFEMYGTIEEN